MVTNFKDRTSYIIISIVWIAALIIINPISNFPLNDDWSYARSVFSLTENGNLEYCGWMSMTLLTQVLWGSIFVKIFGFSFTVLRFSTLLLAFIGAIYTYKLMCLVKVDKKISCLITCVIFLNPIFLNLSFTFMTDVPFYTFSIISIFYFLDYIENDNLKGLIIGLVFSVLSIFTRQLGFCIPLALASIFIFNKDWKTLIPLVVTISLYVFYQFILPDFNKDMGRINEHNMYLFQEVLTNPFTHATAIAKRTFIMFVYFGLFFAPLLLFLRLPKGKYVDWVVLCLAIFVVYSLYLKDNLMPLNKNIIVDFGVGPRTLYDTLVSKETNLDSMILFSRLQVTFIGLMFGMKVIVALLLKTIYVKKLPGKKRIPYYFVALIGFFYLITALSVDAFDRYYLLLFPIIIILFANFLSVHRTVWKGIQWVVMITILFFFSVFGNLDYFNWQRARWDAISYLTEDMKIDKNKIDGGFEYNGWVNYNPEDYHNNVENLWVPDDEYKICFENVNGYSVLKEYKYIEILKFGKEKSIKILKRNE